MSDPSNSQRGFLSVVTLGVVLYGLAFVAVCLVMGYTFLQGGAELNLVFFDRNFTFLISWFLLAGGGVAALVAWCTRVGREWRAASFILAVVISHFWFVRALHQWPQPKGLAATLITAGANLRVRQFDWEPDQGTTYVAYVRQELKGAGMHSPAVAGELRFQGHGLIFSIVLDAQAHPAGVSVLFWR